MVRTPDWLKNLKVTRVDLVDMGANFDKESGEGSHVVIFKSEDSVGDLAKVMTTGQILDVFDLRQSWLKLRDAFEESVSQILNADELTPKEAAALLSTSVSEFSQRAKTLLPKLSKGEADAPLQVIDELVGLVGMPDDLFKKAPELVSKLGGKRMADKPDVKLEDQIAELTAKVETLTKANETLTEANTGLEAKVAEAGKEPEADEHDIEKALADMPAATRALFKAQKDESEMQRIELNKVTDRLAKELDEKITSECVAKAAGFDSIPVDEGFADIIKSAKVSMEPEVFEKLMTVLNAADAAIREGELFKSKGSDAHNRTGGDGAAWTEMQSKAKALVSDGSAPTMEQAITKVAVSDPKLYDRYQKERTGA